MLNFLGSGLLILSLLSACQSEERTELPKSHLPTTERPIIRQFRYDGLEAWIVKPKIAQTSELYLTQNVEKKELICLQENAENTPNTIIVLALKAQEELALSYLHSMNELPIEIKALQCP
jgi:hypothetical protein